MLNSVIASKLWTIAQLTALEGTGAKFRSLAFTKGAKIVGSMSSPVESINLDGVPGIGPTLKQVIGELVKSKGKTCARLKELEREHPSEVLELTSVSGIGAIRAYKLYREHGIKGLNQLLKALESGKIEDEKLKAAVKDAISKRDTGRDRLPLSWVLRTVNEICLALNSVDGVHSVSPAGSMRRFKDDVGDCDILVSVHSKAAKKKVFRRFMAFASGEGDKMILGPQKARIRVPIEGYPFQIDLLVVPRKEWGSALLYFSGSKDFNVGLRKIAIRKKLKLSEHGLTRRGKVVATKTEEAIFKALGLKWIPPELRETEDVEDLVVSSRLVSDTNLPRRDLHTHTTWSDGNSSPESMVETAISLGYTTLALTDHSYSIRKKFGAYVRKMRAVQKKYRKKIKVLVGSEVDIKKDGSLGLTSSQLAQLDFVVGSIHHNHGERVGERIISAARSGEVDIIGHPTGRLAYKREIPECDWAKVFRVCAKRGVALEINPNWDRLDLPSFLVSLAKESGCKFAINTDAHSATHLGKIGSGVRIARRAGLTTQDMYQP